MHVAIKIAIKSISNIYKGFAKLVIFCMCLYILQYPRQFSTILNIDLLVPHYSFIDRFWRIDQYRMQIQGNGRKLGTCEYYMDYAVLHARFYFLIHFKTLSSWQVGSFECSFLYKLRSVVQRSKFHQIVLRLDSILTGKSLSS